MFLLLVPFAFLACVSGHGGVLWPPTWQAGVATPIWKLKNEWVFTEPKARDPNTGREVYKAKSWLTAQAYTGGIGEEFKGIGPKTNINNKNLKKKDRCVNRCNWQRNPWAAPGQAPVVGGGCGVFGGNPWGCPKDKDTRPPGSQCGQDKPIGRGKRGTSSFGTDARLFDFPQMITTKWEIGSVQDVVWTSSGAHRGGYTYRLCKMPRGGRSAITEDCFTRNVLEYATNFTMIKAMNKKGEGKWEKFEQTDLKEGTFPKGSTWRPVGKYVKSATTLRKDSVVVPADLKPGNYVLGWRWDGSGGNQVHSFHILDPWCIDYGGYLLMFQVWVSCASMKLVPGPSVRKSEDNEDDEEPLYTDEEYAELEAAFENEDRDDYEEPLYTDEEYEELEGAFENY